MKQKEEDHLEEIDLKRNFRRGWGFCRNPEAVQWTWKRDRERLPSAALH
jgi:hypothetical protein